MIATSIVLLLISSLVDSSCIHCVSPLITLNARKLDVNFDRTSTADGKCTRNLTKVQLPASCRGACLTVNLTREGETEPSGVLRDCLDSHKRVKNRLELKKETESLAGVCYSESVQIKGVEYSATYCACMGHHCNVDGTPLANREEEQMSRGGERRRGSRHRSPNGGSIGAQSFPIALVALMAARRL